MNKLLLSAALLLALQPYTAKKVRNFLGMDDGWTAGEIRYHDAERAKYRKRLADWEAQNGGAK